MAFNILDVSDIPAELHHLLAPRRLVQIPVELVPLNGQHIIPEPALCESEVDGSPAGLLAVDADPEKFLRVVLDLVVETQLVERGETVRGQRNPGALRSEDGGALEYDEGDSQSVQKCA